MRENNSMCSSQPLEKLLDLVPKVCLLPLPTYLRDSLLCGVSLGNAMGTVKRDSSRLSLGRSLGPGSQSRV